MANLNARVDADFFAMIHQHITAVLPEAPAVPVSEDCRHEERARFLGTQWIAPWDGVNFPADADFREVRCHDLACNGFSFFVPQAIPSLQLVAAFGRRPELIYVAAEQVRSAHVLLFPSGRVTYIESPEEATKRRHPNGEIGKPLVLIGCRFLQRLEVIGR